MSYDALQRKIKMLLAERNAILLVHYYQREEIQDIADLLGDSLALSMEAARTAADVIVFAGVHFMAESASIISPEKTVLLPRLDAGCDLADMIDEGRLARAKRERPEASVVTYINSSAAVKSLSDICCTSANAARVVASLQETKEIIMGPDGNLARYTARLTDKRIIPWEGYCPVHHHLTLSAVQAVKERHPRALFAAHPECTLSVLDQADFVGSTAGILRFARECDAEEVIVGTEAGVIARLKKESPQKRFIPAADDLVCRTMKLTTLEDVFLSLTEMRHVVKVPEEIRVPAQKALDRMLAVS